MTNKQQLHIFLSSNFKNLRLKQPLFYNWTNGLRFDLQSEDVGSEKYFEEVNFRANSIFNSVFEETDEILLVLVEYKKNKSKIKFSNFIFKQILNLKKEDISFTKFKNLYNEKEDFNVAIIKLNKNIINTQNILSAIANWDYPNREPSFGFLSDHLVYFLNLNKKVIFHMYDDRGLDIISTEKETLKPIYIKYNDWILGFDRKKIDKMYL